jgi:hypothetical protein
LIRTKIKELSDKFEKLDSYFKSLPNAVKRISLSDDIISSSEPIDEVDEGKVEVKETDTTRIEEESIVKFHRLADTVLDVMIQIQNLVKNKHDQFVIKNEGTFCLFFMIYYTRVNNM